MRYRRRARHLLFHQHIFRVVQLGGGGDEIARVSPQGGAVECHYSRSGRAREAAHPFAPFPVGRDIFAVVGVGAGEDESSEMLAAHQRAKVRK